MAPAPRPALIARRVLEPFVERIRGRSPLQYSDVLAPAFDARLIANVERVRPYTMTTRERLAGLIDGVEHVLRHELPGAFVECGVWKGGSMMAVALTLLDHGIRDRDLYLCDTFAGMSEPTGDDIAREDVGEPVREAHATWESMRRPDGNDWAYASLEEVRRNLISTGYPAERTHFVKGKVEETLPQAAPAGIALLRLDTDWYESTVHELKHLYPRLCSGGVLILDDYGHWLGSRKAVDEYFAPRAPFLHRLDYSGRLVIKP